jgi:hypothetical protein
LLLVFSLVVAAAGIIMLIDPGARWLAWAIVICGVANLLVLAAFDPTALGGAALGGRARGPQESDDISSLTPQRRRELVRGTSLYLRELNYRYSIRLDQTQTSEQRPFSAEVNSVKLGFVPVVIIDNTNDRQGFGYVAFVHDGKRWRGPGLPCPAGQVEAVRHAAKCVSPLAREEETRF